MTRRPFAVYMGLALCVAWGPLSRVGRAAEIEPPPNTPALTAAAAAPKAEAVTEQAAPAPQGVQLLQAPPPSEQGPSEEAGPQAAPVPTAPLAMQIQAPAQSVSTTETPFYENPWVWTGVGAALIAAVVIIVVIGPSGDDIPDTTLGNMEAFKP